MWQSTQIRTKHELGSDAWSRGYFPASEPGEWDGVTWRRNFHELRLRDLALFCLGDVAGKDILDVACGAGLYMIVIAKMGARVSGQDLSADAVAGARDALKRHALPGSVKTGNATKLLFDDQSFDGVFSGDFVEHITPEEKRLFFAEVFRVLKPGGVFVIKTPNLTYLRLSVGIKRVLAVLRGRSPLSIHIPHTRNNPNNEHHGLITHGKLRRLLLDHMFHSPEFQRHPLTRAHIPQVLQETLPGMPCVWRLFNEHIIVKARKPVFFGYFP